MPYQDRHASEGSDVDEAEILPAVDKTPEAGSNARTIQIIIAIGLFAAVIVAIFGNY